MTQEVTEAALVRIAEALERIADHMDIWADAVGIPIEIFQSEHEEPIKVSIEKTVYVEDGP